MPIEPEGAVALDGEERLDIAWLGHATVDVRMGATRIITDPVLRDRVFHLRRHDGTGNLEFRGQHDGVDVVVISHLHHDHLDLPSIRSLPPDTLVVVPRGAARLVERSAPGEVIEMSPEDEIRVGNVRITAVPAEHHPGRFMSRVKAQPLGFVMEHRDSVVYFPGDTDLHPVMSDLPAPDVALLPIWGWGKTLGVGHLDPGRAAEAAALLRASCVLPVHWGTFAPASIRPGRPAWLEYSAQLFTEALDRHSPQTRLELVRPGPDLLSFS